MDAEHEGKLAIGFILPDYVVEERLRVGWAAVQKNPALVAHALIRYGESFVQQAMTLLARTKIPIYEGWPMEEAHVPGIGITLAQESEDSGGQQIGPRGVFTRGNAQIRAYATPMHTSVQIAHYGTTQRGATVMALVSKWVLMQYRTAMEEEDGLREATVVMGDYNPNTDFAPEHAFMRLVMLNCAYEDSWAEELSPLIASVSVEVSNQGEVLTL